jgi:NAD(P)-dependent dehydrogenase (short-subunit alcohol dehydrogenase family)
MSKNLGGKIAVITGGNSGIGLATARRFVAEGAHVFISVAGRRSSMKYFFAAQMQAARFIQQAAFDRWKANQRGPCAGMTSLAVRRQRLYDLNREPIDALAELRPWLSGRNVQQALPQRAEVILTGNGPAGVRETDIAPYGRHLRDRGAERPDSK